MEINTTHNNNSLKTTMQKGNFENNRESWNELATIHVKSKFYDLR